MRRLVEDGPVVASDPDLQQADTLAIIVPATTGDRGWPNHVRLRGPDSRLSRPTFAVTEQPRAVQNIVAAIELPDRVLGVDRARSGESH